jgi:hypothetical protein
MKKKTVLIIGYGIDENRYEAVSKNTIKHKKILEELGYKVYIYNIGYKNKYFNTGNGFLESLKRRDLILLNLKNFIKKNKISHILDEFVLPLSSQIFSLPLKKYLPEVRFIKEVHNDSGFSFKSHPETFIRIIANNRISLNNVLTNFDDFFTKNLFLSKKKNIKYIPTDIAIHSIPKVKIKNNIINICYLGHPLQKKGIFEFLDLFKILPVELKNKIIFNFSFSDVGPRERVVKQFKDVAQEENIKVNFSNEVKPYEFYRKNDIYILPIHDHFGAVSTPNTILEAMEAGCLVITNKIKSLEGMFENNEVIYLDNYHSKNILKTIKEVLKDTKNEDKRILKARNLIETKHNIKNIKKLIETVYE